MKGSIKKLLSSIRTFCWAGKQIAIAAPFEMIGLSVFILLQGAVPAASLYAVQGIFNWLSTSMAFPIFFVVLWGFLLFCDVALSPFIAVIRLHLNEKMLTHCNVLLMEKANRIQSLLPFENAKFYDEIQFLKNESNRRPLNFIYVVSGLAKDGIGLISVLAVLFSIDWWIPCAIALACVPQAMSTLWFEKQAWDQLLFRSPHSRKLAWFSSVTLDDRLAKEVRLFGFGHFLIQKYKDLAGKSLHFLSTEQWRSSFFPPRFQD